MGPRGQVAKPYQARYRAPTPLAVHRLRTGGRARRYRRPAPRLMWRRVPPRRRPGPSRPASRRSPPLPRPPPPSHGCRPRTPATRGRPSPPERSAPRGDSACPMDDLLRPHRGRPGPRHPHRGSRRLPVPCLPDRKPPRRPGTRGPALVRPGPAHRHPPLRTRRNHRPNSAPPTEDHPRRRCNRCPDTRHQASGQPYVSAAPQCFTIAMKPYHSRLRARRPEAIVRQGRCFTCNERPPLGGIRIGDVAALSAARRRYKEDF